MTLLAVLVSAVVVSALYAGLRGWFSASRRLARHQRELDDARAVIRSLRAVEGAAAQLLDTSEREDRLAAERRLADALEASKARDAGGTR